MNATSGDPESVWKTVEFEYAVCPRSPIAPSLNGYTAPTPRGAVNVITALVLAPPTW